MVTTAAANFCLYCGASDIELTDEHVIPESIHGRLLIPKSSCRACQKLIESDIETPLISNMYSRLRRSLGYPQKYKRKKKRRQWRENPSRLNSVEIILQRKTPPFQKSFFFTSEKKGPLSSTFIYNLPPFMRPENYKAARGASLRIEYDKKEVFDYANSLMLADLDAISWRWAFKARPQMLFNLLLAKISIGTIYHYLDGYSNESLRRFLQVRHYNKDDLHFLSCPRKDFEIQDFQIKIFSVSERNNNYLYLAISILPEVFDQIYFVRLRNEDMKGITPVTINYNL